MAEVSFKPSARAIALFDEQVKDSLAYLGMEKSKFNQAANALCLARALKALEDLDVDENSRKMLKLELCYLGGNASANRQRINGERKSAETKTVDISDLDV